jgi:hypothetical protein
MLHEIERSFANRGVNTVRLEVRVGNEPALRLYEHLGYSIVQRMTRYYSNGDDGYLMVKSLDELSLGRSDPSQCSAHHHGDRGFRQFYRAFKVMR